MKIAIIGGGAAGLMAAVVASKKHQVTIYEKQSRVGKKLFASGNGKCNLTNSVLTRQNLAEENCFYNCKEACDVVSRFDYDDFMSFCQNELGIETMVDSQGRVYPRSEHGGSVLDAFRVKCQKNGVKICDETPIIKLEKQKRNFKVLSNEVEFGYYDKVIFCIGSDVQTRNFHSFELLKYFDVNITKTQTSITPIKTKKVWLQLNGIKAKCKATLLQEGKEVASEVGEVLFRDYGLSGIAIFNLSVFIARNIVKGINANYAISLDLFPELDENQLCYKLNKRLVVCGKESKTFFVGLLNNKIAEVVIKNCGLGETVSNKDISKIANYLKNMKYDVLELCDQDKGQVMSGGIDFAEIDENMQSRKTPGLYFAGECLNADGLCGGFNLQFAFSSGFIAGSNV